MLEPYTHVFMMQAVFPPGVIAVTLSGPISCLQNQRAGGVLFGRDMASKPWLDHDFFLETMMPKEALKKEDRIRLGSPWPKSRQCRIEQQDVVEECYGPSAPAHDLLALLKQG